MARLKGMEKAIQSPRRWWRTMRNNRNQEGPDLRVRRGLVDAVGHAFKFLFGSATDDEVQDIKRVVGLLAQKQDRMLSLMSEFTTVINHTYDEIQTNRNQLNSVRTTLYNLSRRLDSDLSSIVKRIRIQERRTNIEFLLNELDKITQRFVHAHEAFLHRKENLEAGRLTENILPPSVLYDILTSAGQEMAQMIQPIQWYYENTAIIPIWTEDKLIYRTRLPLVDPVPWHHVTIEAWPVPIREWEATVLIPPQVLRDTRTGELDVSPSCHGHRPRICRRGLIHHPSVYACLARLLDVNPGYDETCVVSMKRRVPIDVVHPQIANIYVLITDGTELILRCEGRPERSTNLLSGVYRLVLDYPCSLHGTNWNLLPIFQRRYNISLQAAEVPFTITTSIEDLFSNLTDWNPLVLDLNELDPVDRKQFTFGDLQDDSISPPQRIKNQNIWHSFWAVLFLGLTSGTVWLWRRRRPAQTATPDIELQATQAPLFRSNPRPRNAEPKCRTTIEDTAL